MVVWVCILVQDRYYSFAPDKFGQKQLENAGLSGASAGSSSTTQPVFFLSFYRFLNFNWTRILMPEKLPHI